ncbi:SPX (SYG1/Pho81/XPR1) domain-containing protein / zinc finger (C3HC4-type RING finger) protein-like protein [Wolffia australiana]
MLTAHRISASTGQSASSISALALLIPLSFFLSITSAFHRRRFHREVFIRRCRKIWHAVDFEMKFGEVLNDYLHGGQEQFLNKCSYVEYKRLKKVLKSCRICRSCHEKGEENPGSSQTYECDSCSACDKAFFDELAKEASEISGFFTSRARHLIHRHDSASLGRYLLCLQHCVANEQQTVFQQGKMLIDYVTINATAVRKILKKYDKVHCSVNGRKFKMQLRAQQIEPLQSPWLIELGALCMRLYGPHIEGSNMFFQQLSCDLTESEPAVKLILSDSIELKYSLTCAICLEMVFRPFALGCGHLFCKSCACSAASLLFFEDLKAASPEAKCPVCRAPGIYAKSMHMIELDLLLKKSCPEYWKDRKSAERVELMKQSKQYWNMQTKYMIGYY